MTTDTFQRLTRAELRDLKPGTWVAWYRHKGVSPGISWLQGQVLECPVRCSHDVSVRFDGVPCLIPKNRLFKDLPVVEVEYMHEGFDYNA
jgi:hypothetical protein